MQHKKSSEVNILFFSKKKKYIYIYILKVTDPFAELSFNSMLLKVQGFHKNIYFSNIP